MSQQFQNKVLLFALPFDTQAQVSAENVVCHVFERADIELEDMVVIRSRSALKLLQGLDESKATGPDHIPASSFKKVAKETALPFTILCRRLLQEASSPQICDGMLFVPFTSAALLSWQGIIAASI